MAEESGARARFGATLVAILAALGSLVSAGVSYWQNMEARKENQRAFEQKQLELDRNYQVVVVEKVTDALKADAASDPARVNVAAALVFTLPDTQEGPSGAAADGQDGASLKKKLALIVMERAAKVSTEVGGGGLDATVAELRSIARQEADEKTGAARPAAAPSSGAPAPAAITGTQKTLSAPSATGWDIDVFWCAGADSAQNRARAQRMGDALAAAANAQTAVGANTLVGRVRVRELREAVNARGGYGVSRDEIRAESSETETAQKIAAFLTEKGFPGVATTTSTSLTPWYLSLFVCGGGSAPSIRPRPFPVTAD
ncbi:MAG: hypothetical protein AB7M12_13685 [Hyphomonadaceae bacterium]